MLCPGGHSGWNEADASIYLRHLSTNDAINIDYGFGINDGDGRQAFHVRTANPLNFVPSSGGSAWVATARGEQNRHGDDPIAKEGS